ncbi:unnamed protein product [Didymodactylos carnosus]|uniref:N-acetyltransferase domain-containing protein n=1 Tax=Didymodactylos carnosus TaxID=1234261 RepID=A0A813VSW0_9BILA|nr:unnamed protein product [Didymodactylos carnosus]CAF1064863.1 unnamed protein product [Didymodactylos carnosus]CAF3629390.1 unnamed protein product [Didymodactylos carnosus]CAF3829977.1 unnamed protein product [Didymodactylos carnosus]
MDNDNFVLEKIPEKSSNTYVLTPKIRPRIKIQPHDTDGVVLTANGLLTNGNKSQSDNDTDPDGKTERDSTKKSVPERPSTISNNSNPERPSTMSNNSNKQILSNKNSVASTSVTQPPPTTSLRTITTPNFTNVEMTDVHDTDEEYDEDRDHMDPTMGDDHYHDGDELEVHQLSVGDIDAYLDIYFETLDNRLKHLIGDEQQLTEFRTATKERIKSDPNSREYQTVLLGKIGGEVLAAVTMLFNGDQTTIARTQLKNQQQRGCFSSIRNWMVNKANYTPIYTEECYIEMIGVKANYRRQGIGAAMLECVEHFARKAGARWLTIHIQGRLRDYFERYGFQVAHTDYSPLWKWFVERESSEKLTKQIAVEEEDEGGTAGQDSLYINESME